MNSNKNKYIKRETFSSGIGVFFATLGSAVGLGNIWKFPYMVGANGGGAFLLMYLICIVLVGLPIMISEFCIGRRTRKNIIGAMETIKPKSAWKTIGIFGIASSYLIMFFYTCVGGWVYLYVFKILKGDFKNVTVQVAKSQFDKVTAGPISPIIWQLIVLIVVSMIIIAGVQKGIERVAKTLMPMLFILIIICDIRALTLPGAFKGVEFLFKIDFSMMTKAGILAALGLGFFKLSLGMGTMTTYGSYFTDDNNMPFTALKVALSDTIVSLLAGLAIFPAVFSFNMEPGAGPGLLFMTIPLVFSKMPFGTILLVAFFLLTAMATTTAMLSLMEVPTAYFTEEKGWSRRKAVITNCFIIGLSGIFATLSASSKGVLGSVTIFGKTFFNLFDYISSNILMPIGGLSICILMGYFVDKSFISEELSNKGKLNNDIVINIIRLLLKYITPILLIIIFANAIGII